MGRQRLRLQTFVPYRLSVTSNLVSDVISKAYKSLFALSVPEWRLVAILAEHDKLSQSGLGAAARMDKVMVSRAAISLAARDLVKREADPDDGRAQLLSLSEAGRILYDQVAPAALALEKRLLEKLTREEVGQLMQILDKLELASEAMETPSG